VAFLYRGICKFEEKVILAAEAGAAVVVIVNNNPEGVITMSIGKAEKYKVISLMITNKSGYQILQVLKEKVDYENVFLKVSKGTPTVGFEKIIVIVICLAFFSSPHDFPCLGDFLLCTAFPSSSSAISGPKEARTTHAESTGCAESRDSNEQFRDRPELGRNMLRYLHRQFRGEGCRQALDMLSSLPQEVHRSLAYGKRHLSTMQS